MTEKPKNPEELVASFRKQAYGELADIFDEAIEDLNVDKSPATQRVRSILSGAIERLLSEAGFPKDGSD